MRGFQLKKIPWMTLGRPESFSEIEQKANEQRSRLGLMAHRPVFSIITRTPASETFPLLESLKAQSYPHWELINEGNPTKGDWVGYFSPTDVLSPVALFFFVLEAQRKPHSDVLYSHEVYLTSDYHEPVRLFSKGEYSWFNLIHFNFLGHSWFAHKDLVNSTPLTLNEETENWSLIPAYLCYRTDEPSILNQNSAQVDSYLKRKGFSAKVSETVVDPIFQPDAHLISAVICFRDRADWTIRCLESLVRAKGETPLEIFLVNNQSTPEEKQKVVDATTRLKVNIRIIDDERPFNFGQMNNETVANHARGDLLLFLNNDVFLNSQGALDKMTGWAIQDGIGTVGICLRYPHGGIQHSGFRAIYGGQSRMARVGHGHNDDVFARARREVFGNTFAACMVRRSVYEGLGGLRSVEYPNGFGDVAFNLELHRQGFHNLYLGDIEGIHLESASRGLSYEYWEEVGIEREFPGVLQKMLRCDTGFDVVPKPDFSWGQIKEMILGSLYRKFPFTLSCRAAIKSMLVRLHKGRPYLCEDPVHSIPSPSKNG